VVGLKKSVDAAKEAEVSQAKLKAQLHASGISYRAHAKDIDAVIQKHSRLAGVDDEDLQDAFTGLVRTTGSVSKSMHDMGLVTDIARGKHIDVTKAAELLGKVHNGNVAVLKRYGIAIDPITKAQDKLKESNKKATAEQIAAAKATDKTATSQKAMAELQKRFGGQAEAYGKTAAGASDRFHVALENVEEKLGKGLLPILAKVTGGVATFLQGIDSGKGVGGRFATAMSTGFNRVKTTVQTVIAAVRGYLTRHREDIQNVIEAFKRVASFAKTTWQETLLPIVRRTVAAIKPIVQGVADLIRGIVRTISGLLSGNWSKAWSGAKEAVSGAWKLIKTAVSTGAQNLWEIVKDLGPKLIKLLLKGLANLGKALATGIFEGIKAAAAAVPGLAAGALKGLGHAITGAIQKGLGKLNPFGDGLGSPGGDGMGMLFPSLGGFSGGLDGANAFMGPFASLGSSMGLHLTAGRNHHSTMTTSGNVSYHSSGDAIDEAGPFPAMHRYAQALYSRFGGRLRELISPWPELGIKDGHPFRYDAAIQAQHSGSNAHVHVAYAPSGDGLGNLRNGPRPAMSRSAVAALAESVGLPGITFADIARGESGYDPDNVGHDPGGSTGLGLWQITTKFNDDIISKYGGVQAMFDPRRNALAARDIWRRQGRKAWVGTQYVTGWDLHYKGPLSGGSSRGRAGSTVSTGPRTITYTATVPGGPGAGTANSGTLTAGPGAGSGYSKGPAMYGPAAAGRTDAGRLEQIGLGLAQNQGKKTKTAQLLFEEAVIKRRRLDAVKKALKGRLTKKARTALTEEATTLIGELRDISTAMYELTGGKAGLSPGGNIAGSKAELAERAANDPKAEAPDLPTAGDFVDAAIAEAALTPDTADDIAAASGAVGYWEAQLAAAQANGDPRLRTAAASGLKSARDNLAALRDAINANTDALNGVRADLEAQRADQAEASLKVSQSQYGVLAQAVWDAANQFGGARIGLGLSGLNAPAGAMSRA
jgi:hypothetical protein